jgi:hypothetical protein
MGRHRARMGERRGVYRVAQVAACSQINSKHINTVCAERTVVEC